MRFVAMLGAVDFTSEQKAETQDQNSIRRKSAVHGKFSFASR